MSGYKERVKKVIDAVFDEMDSLSDEEFAEELKKYTNGNIGKALLYAWGMPR